MSGLTEISIFKPSLDTQSLTTTERGILFKELRHQSKLPQYHFEAFQELEDELLDETKYSSNIPALMVKNIISNVCPIVGKESSKEFSISMQLNVPIQCKHIDLSDGNIVASNSKINIVGVAFNSVESSIIRINIPTPVQTASIHDRLLTGNYSLWSWNYKATKPGGVPDQKYFQECLSIAINDFKTVVMFNKDNVSDTLTLLGNYVQYMTDYYDHNLFFMHSSILANSKKIVDTQYKHIDIQKPIKSGLIKTLNSIYTNKLSPINKVVLMYDIMYGNMWKIYQSAKILGIDHKETVDAIEREKERQLKNIMIRKNINREIDQKQLYYMKAAIALKLFKKSDFKDLTEKELDVIDLTIAKDIEFAKMSEGVKCGHIQLLGRVMKSSGANKQFNQQAWDALKGMFPIPSNDKTLLKCKSCALLVLCPHHYDQFEFKRDRASEFTDAELRKMLLRKYADNTPIRNAYYCKICGEQIVKKYTEKHTSFIQGEKVSMSREIDTLNNKIWKEVRNIISSHVEFNVVTDVNVMTSNITSTIQPYIEVEQDKLKKIKTNTFETVRSGVYLFIAIYCFASLVRLISHYPNDMQFKRTFKKKVGGDNNGHVDTRFLQSLMKTAIITILTTKKTLIESIPHMSVDVIKPLLVMAYKNISKLYVKTEQFTTELPPEYVADNIVYKYLYYVKKKHDKSLKYSDVRSILGIDLSELKTVGIIDKVDIPKQWVSVKPNEEVGVFYDPKMSELYGKYAYASFLHFIKYVKNRLYTFPVFKSIKHQLHEKEYNELFEVEKVFLDLYEKMYRLPIYYYYNEQYGQYTFKPVNLLTMFCGDGRKHNFNIHIYEYGITQLEVSKKNIDEWMFDSKKNAEFSQMKRVDLKCSVCGVFMSKATEQNIDVTQVLNTRDEINGFYNLYIFKCPVKNMHIFKNDECTQCSVTKQMIFKHDREYFEKYKQEFYKDRIVVGDDIAEQLPTYIPHKTEEFVDNTNTIHELSRISKMPIVLLNSIGSIEGVDYEKIKSGESVLRDTTTNLTNRVSYVENYITTLFVEYEMLRSGRTNVPKLDAILEKWSMVDFSKFPDISTPFQQKKKLYMKNDAQYISFTLYCIFSALLLIYKHSSEESIAGASATFVSYILNKILEAEKIFSDPGILRGKMPDIEDDDGDAVDADYDDKNVEIGEGYDPFSLEGSDIDTSQLADNLGTGDD